VAFNNHCTNGSGEIGCTNLQNPSNAGEDCMAANCHGTPLGQGALAWTFAGTVYADTNYAAPATGIPVTFSGVTAVTDTAGNFYSSSAATSGSASTPKVNMATAATGDCNSSGCHMAKPGQTMPGAGSGINGTGNGSIYN
jgi:hypothetical protein